MPITIESTITFTLGGVVGFIVSELIKDRLARIRGIEAIRIVEFNKGAAEFRSAFVDIIHSINKRGSQRGNDEWYFFLRELHTDEVDIRIEKAKILFEPYLTASELDGFNTAWKNYIEWPSHLADKNNDDPQPDFLGHIYSLLEYAKPK